MKSIIEKWYLKLGFPQKYNEEFYKALDEITIPEDISPDTYDPESTDGKRNLLSFLYMCESAEKKYKQKGIDESILLDTLYDIVRRTNTWSDIKGELYFGDIFGVGEQIKLKIFKIGRLEYYMETSRFECLKHNLKKGDNTVSVHIPASGPLDYDECVKSLKLAKEFFAKYYPDFGFDCFICGSWLLDKSLAQILKPDSNILRFQTLFDIVTQAEDEAILCYVFARNATLKNLDRFTPPNRLAEEVKKRYESGGVFYSGLGIIDADSI